MVNLSEGGCRIQTDSQVYTGIQLILRLHVPNEDAPISPEKWQCLGIREGEGFITVDLPDRERLSHPSLRVKE